MKKSNEEKMMMINAVADEWLERFQKLREEPHRQTDEAIDFRVMCVKLAVERLTESLIDKGERFPNNLESRFHSVWADIFFQKQEEMYAGREGELYKTVDEEDEEEDCLVEDLHRAVYVAMCDHFSKFTYDTINKYYGFWVTPNHPDVDKESVLH